MKKTICTITFLILLIGCATEKNDSKNKLYIPLTDEHVIECLSADSIFSAGKYIALETTEESLIYEIGKIIIDDSADIYILDKKLDQIVVFDFSGKYKWKLNKKGPGADEYMDVNDFLLRDNFLYLLSSYSIIKYDKKGNFIDKIAPIENSCDELIFTEENIYLYSSFQSSTLKNIFVIDRSNQKITESYKDFPLAQLGIGSSNRSLFQTNTSLYATFPYKYNIYKLEKDKYYEILQVDFPFNKIYSKELQESSSDKRNEYRFKLPDYDWPIEDISDLIVHNDIFIFSFVYRTFRRTVFYNTSTKKKLCGYIAMSPSYPIVTPVFKFYQNGKIIQVVSPEYLYNLKENTDISKNIKKLYTTEDSNPILAIYDLKL